MKPVPPTLRYGTAALSLGVAIGLILLYPPFQERGAFVLFLGAITISAWVGGIGPALLAAGIATLYCAIYILPPEGVLGRLSPEDAARLAVFVLVASAIASLHESRRRALRNLEAAQQRLEYALDVARMGVWEAEPDAHKFWWSAGIENIFGAAPGRFSRTYEDFVGYIHPDDQDFLRRAALRAGEGGTDFEIDHRIVRADGSTCYIKTRGRILVDRQGRRRILATVMELPDAGGRVGEHSLGAAAGGSM